MKFGSYGEALKDLETIIRNEKRDWNRVLPLINQIYCFLQVHDKNNANIASVILLSLIERKEVVEKLNLVSEICDEELEKLIFELAEKNSTEIALTLNQCRVILIRQLRSDGLNKLQRLGLVGYSMLLIAKKMQTNQIIFKQNQGWRFTRPSLQEECEKHYSIMNEIFFLMKSTIVTDTRRKTKEIVWFLQSFGFCCDLYGDYNKSVKIYSQAKLRMETEFAGGEMDRYRALGHCYNTMLYSYNQAVRNSKHSFEQFLQLCKQVIFVIAVCLIISLSLMGLWYLDQHFKVNQQTKDKEKQNATSDHSQLGYLFLIAIALAYGVIPQNREENEEEGGRVRFLRHQFENRGARIRYHGRRLRRGHS